MISDLRHSLQRRGLQVVDRSVTTTVDADAARLQDHFGRHLALSATEAA